MYYFTLDVRFDLTGKIKLNKDKEITQLITGDDSVSLTSAPLYYKDELKTIFPKNMVCLL